MGTKRPPRCSQHKDKVIFKNEVVAHQTLIQLRGKYYTGSLHFYKCDFADHWHIGHEPGGKDASTNRR